MAHACVKSSVNAIWWRHALVRRDQTRVKKQFHMQLKVGTNLPRHYFTQAFLPLELLT